jgi:hypothetical protein
MEFDIDYLFVLTDKEYEEYWFTWNYFTAYPDASLIMFLQMFPYETISRETLKYLNYLNPENIQKPYYYNKLKCNDLIIDFLVKQFIISAYESKKTFMNKLYYLFEYIYNMYNIVIINRPKENSIPIINTSKDYTIKCYWSVNRFIYSEYYKKNIQKQNIKILPDHLEALFKLKKPLKIRSKSRKERHRPKLYL